MPAEAASTFPMHEGVLTRRGDASRSGVILAGACVLGIIGVALWAIMGSSTRPDEPVPVAWDRQPCTYCSMHLGEPAFAVQLHAAGGDVLFFDDPGCYFAYLADHPTEARTTWFHDLHQDRWLPESMVKFLPVATSPMGWGLGAVALDTEDAMSVGAARALVLAGRRGDGTRRELPAR